MSYRSLRKKRVFRNSIALLPPYMEGLKRRYEIIFVDDGSRDGSFRVLEEIQKKDAHVVVVSFRRNFGQTAAMAAGFDYGIGDIFITMDADLQNDPEDIPLLLEKIKDVDVVSGWRKNRKDKFISRKASFDNRQLADQ